MKRFGWLVSVVAVAALGVSAFADPPTMPELGLDTAAGVLLTQLGTMANTLMPYLILMAAVGIIVSFAFRWMRRVAK